MSNVFIIQWRQAFENWNRNFFRMRNRPNSRGNVRIRNLMSVFLPNTRCVYHEEITVSYMVVGFAPNHWNSKRQTFAFSFGPVSKHFLTIVAHIMRSPLLVLITKMNFKICLVGTLDEQGYVTSLTIECVASTYVAEGLLLQWCLILEAMFELKQKKNYQNIRSYLYMWTLKCLYVVYASSHMYNFINLKLHTNSSL